MPNLFHTIAYFVKFYPNQSKLTVSWIMMSLFLSDLLSCFYSDERLFNFSWEKGRFCPFSKEVNDFLMHSECFNLKGDSTKYNHRRFLVSLKNPESFIKFNFKYEEKKIFDYVIKSTSNFDWEKMLTLTNSTFPFINNSKGHIDILEQARDYKQRVKFEKINS